jgi:ribbon-helix-helix CopG family protein
VSSGENNPIEELWEHRHDPEEWSEKAIEIEARPTGSTVVSFRLPYEEYEVLEEAASERGETLSEFIRQAVRLRLGGRPKVPVVVVTVGGAPDFRLRTNIPEHLRGTEPSSVPDSDRDLLAGTAS